MTHYLKDKEEIKGVQINLSFPTENEEIIFSTNKIFLAILCGCARLQRTKVWVETTSSSLFDRPQFRRPFTAPKSFPFGGPLSKSASETQFREKS